MAKLDVTVLLYENGVLVSGKKSVGGSDSARLGKAVIGKMRLGKS